MHSDKKISKEDTWKPAELRRHIRDGGYEEDRARRREEYERKHGGVEAVERRHHRDPDKERRRDRDRHTERDKQKVGENNPYLDNTRERDKRKDEGYNPYLDRRKEGSRDRRAGGEERDKEKRRDRERASDPSKHSDEHREHKDRRHNREEQDIHSRERDRQREKERRRDREREDGHERDRDRRREERDRERRREERDREHGREKDRRRHEEGEEMGRDRERRRDRERENVIEEGERRKHEPRERREKHTDRRQSEHKEEQVHKEDRQKEREDREQRHKERGHHDEKRKHDSDGHHRGDRDRRERDKHRERRHREEADPEADETTAPKPYQGSRDKTTPSKIQEAVILPEPHTTSPTDLEETEEPVAEDEESAEVQDSGDQDYEDDFEDYEEDFEEESGGEGEDEEPSPSPMASGDGEAPTPQASEEIKAIRRAMEEENERVGTAAQSGQSLNTYQDRHTRSRDVHDRNQSRGSQRGKFINFVAAKQREVSKQVANKQKKRSAELLRLIDLDFSSTFSLLDLPPVSEYDMYIKSFGNTNTKQAYVQCNEDNVDRDIQTEDIEMSEKWTQHPAERQGPCGDPRLSQDGRDKRRRELSIDTQGLTAFLLSASQVMVVLLEEDYAQKQSLKRLSTKAEILSFSDGSLQFNTKLSFLKGRRVSLVHFSPVQNQTMMSVHGPMGKPGAVRLDTWTMICIWNIWEPSRPQKILVYESEVECCCFSPGKATLVFAGTSVGSVLLWDLRERAGNHDNLKLGEDEWTFRHPTFSTDAVLATSGHLSAVCCVEVVPSTVSGSLRPEAPMLASDEELSGLSFQLASLDVNGVLNHWVVLELPKASDCGSQTDLGLRPGGKVKLLHSSTLLTTERTSPRDALNTGSYQTLLLRFLPTDSNHFFVGTNMGVVNHGTSHGLKAPPKLYRSGVVGVRPTDVTSIHFSPFSPDLFLVGCADGSIRLHSASQDQPVLEWSDSTAGEPVVSVEWTRTRPTVFCVLDQASNLHIWDLQRSDLEPVVTERIDTDRVTAMSVFGDSGQQNTYSGVALAHQSGKLQVQYFNERFTVPSAAEPEMLERMINDAF